MAETWKKLAYLDEVATLSDVTPESVGTAGAAGTGTAASREDHVHDLGTGCIDASNLFAAGVVDETALGALAVTEGKIGALAVTAAKLAANAVETAKIKDLNVTTGKIAADAIDATKIADDAIGSEHIESLSAALDVNGQQLTDAVLENNAADPGTPVLGKIYFKTGDLHPYVCTAIA